MGKCIPADANYIPKQEFCLKIIMKSPLGLGETDIFTCTRYDE